jgi:hypothetical protein
MEVKWRMRRSAIELVFTEGFSDVNVVLMAAIISV